MKQLTRSASLLLAIAAATPLYASTLIPAKGQTPEQIQADTAACQSQATQASQSAAARSRACCSAAWPSAWARSTATSSC